MDIKAYIESGLIESFVLGLANEEENADINKRRSIYPEINQAIEKFATDLELNLIFNPIPPPAYIKEKIFNTLNLTIASKQVLDTNITVNNTSPVRNVMGESSKWKWMAAASFLLLILSSVLNLILFNRYTDKKDAYQALLSEKESLFAANKIYQASYKEWEQTSNMMSDPTFVMVKMKTAPGKNNKDVTVFWDSKSKEVYVLATALHNPTMGKQFQLWAIVDGKPIDAGIIDTHCTGLCKMKNIIKAQSFAITLERLGGNPNPTMDQLLVIGTV